MGRTKKEESPGGTPTRQLDPKSKSIDKARARNAREALKKSYKEDSESEPEVVDKFADEPEDAEFSGGDPSPSESGSDWAGESSGSEYGKKKTKVGRGRAKKAVASPKKGAAKGRGRGRPAGKAKATPVARNGSKKGPAKRRRDDSDESEESEGESSGSEYGKKASPAKKRPSTSRGSPAKKNATAPPASESSGSRQSRGRGASSKSYKEVSEDDFSEEEIPVVRKPKAAPKPKPQAKKRKEESEEDDHFSDAVSGSEDEEPKEKEKKSAPKSKAEAKSSPASKVTKNGSEEKEKRDSSKAKDDSDNESKKSDVSSKSGESEVKEKEKEVEVGLKNRTDTDYSSIKFDCDKKTSSGDSSNFKISSWNIGGIKAFLKKNGLEYIKRESPDVLCLQEIKCNEKTKPDEFKKVDGYPFIYWCFADQPGMHGVAVLSKSEPISVKNGLPVDDDDSDSVKSSKEKFGKEGRLITAEYEKFYLVNAYVPNGGRGDKSEEHANFPKGYPPKIINGERQKFDDLFRAHIKKLEDKKPVVVTGDLNVSHAEIDLANPKTNDRTAGFTKEEREGMTKLLDETTLFDSFRSLYPDKNSSYTFWSYMHNARQKNVGWRLDYFLLSDKLRDSLCDNVMRTEVFGSDHCPIVLFLRV